jgi:hypothetical protein
MVCVAGAARCGARSAQIRSGSGSPYARNFFPQGLIGQSSPATFAADVTAGTTTAFFYGRESKQSFVFEVSASSALSRARFHTVPRRDCGTQSGYREVPAHFFVCARQGTRGHRRPGGATCTCLPRMPGGGPRAWSPAAGSGCSMPAPGRWRIAGSPCARSIRTAAVHWPGFSIRRR